MYCVQSSDKIKIINFSQLYSMTYNTKLVKKNKIYFIIKICVLRRADKNVVSNFIENVIN